MVFANFSVARFSAASHGRGWGASLRCARCRGCSKRVCSVTGLLAVRCRVEPLVHRRPKLAGWVGSPRTPVICAPSDSMITPQPTPQWGQVVFVSCRAWIPDVFGALAFEGKNETPLPLL